MVVRSKSPKSLIRMSIEESLSIDENSFPGVHATQNSAKKFANTEQSHCPARRSPMKTGSCYFSRVKKVTFAPSIQVRPINAKSDDDIKVLWLSKEERHQILLRCNDDLKILKRIAQSPEAAKNDPEIQKVRSSISIRGLEQHSSLRLHRALSALQQDHIHAVLGAQDMLRDMTRCSGVAPDPLAIAQISAEHSLDARKRALRQGMSDEDVAFAYLSS